MQANGFITLGAMVQAKGRALPIVRHDEPQALQSSAVVEHVLEEFNARYANLSVEDFLLGRIQVYATADARVQHIVNEALEHGLERYEQRHPKARGMIQGSVVVLQNRDGRILAETGGRQIFNGRSAFYSDYNRVTQSLRQPGSAMKPIVYLAAFRHGFTRADLSQTPSLPTSHPPFAQGASWRLVRCAGCAHVIRTMLTTSRRAAASRRFLSRMSDLTSRFGVVIPASVAR
jgi:penicillin-binding protein 1A